MNIKYLIGEQEVPIRVYEIRDDEFVPRKGDLIHIEEIDELLKVYVVTYNPDTDEINVFMDLQESS